MTGSTSAVDNQPNVGDGALRPLGPPSRGPRRRSARRKSEARAAVFGLLRRALNPAHLWQAARLQAKRRANRHAVDAQRLALYARILPSDFLHFGYFDDPERRPEDMSLAEVAAAQTRYAELLIALAAPPDAGPALDVGCGMGGLCRMLRDRGYSPVALTPDRLQAAHVAATLPGVPVIRSKFEEMDEAPHAAAFATVFTSESLQYLDLDVALPRLAALLRPGGRWVACDFFHARPSADRSLHELDPFLARLPAHGWRVTYQRDVTANIRPTLAYIHMWAVRFGLPLMEFAFLRMRRKQPGLHHLAADLLADLRRLAEKNLETIDPVRFEADKRYVLLVMERA